MQPTAPAADGQRPRSHLDSVGIFALLNEERFVDTIEANLPRFRQRLYPPVQTLAMFVSQVLSDDRSCQRVVNEHVARCAARAVELPASSTSAYCEARQRLPITLVSSLCREVASMAHARSAPNAADTRATLLIDGTGFSMPDTAANQNAFPQSASQREGCGFPQGRLVALVCAASGAVIEARIGADKGKRSDEPTALRTMLPAVAAGTLVIGDAIYENYWSWAALEHAGCEAVFEINGSRDLSLSPPRRLTLERPRRPPWMSPEQYADTPERIEVRVVISRRPGGDNRVLISSLLDEGEHSDEMICALHQSRWDVELDFRSLKDTLEAGILGCRTPDMVTKELWVHLLGYNLIRLLMAEAAQSACCQACEISFRHAQQSWMAWVLLGAPLDEHGWQRLLERIACRRVRQRPGRREPRAVKRRPKPRALLDLPRDIARICHHAYERRRR